MARKAQRDWLEVGLQILAEVGTTGLTIDAMTATLGVTKGSFYHHFESFQEFKERLLAFFEQEGTLSIISGAEEAGSSQEKIQHLIDVTVDDPSEVEVAIRAWALQDDVVRAHQARIDGRRLSYLREICEALTGDEARALTMARLLYAIYIGSQHIIPPIKGDARRQLYDEFKRLYSVS